MAVYKRNYRAWTGPLTSERSRFLVLTRYAWANIFRSRIVTGLFILCYFPPLIILLGTYLNHNTTLLGLVHLPTPLIDDYSKFLRGYTQIQTGLAMLLTCFIAPALVSPDLAHNALPLYLCRPITRTEYVLGKFLVIAWVLSLITWIPGLILFSVEASLSGASWAWHHLYLAGAVFGGSLAYILVLSMVGLALSAWVKWKPVAGALVLGVFMFSGGIAAALAAILRSTSALQLDVSYNLYTLSLALFHTPAPERSTFAALVQLSAVLAFCAWLLFKKIRALEVVKS